MKQNIWRSTFPVASYLVNAEKQLSLHGLISLVQEMAWSHAGHLGFGFAEVRARGDSWILARQRIEIQRWPEWEDQLTVVTWLRPPGAVIVTRDFEFYLGSEKVGHACAHWLTISHATRRPTRIPFPDDRSLFRQDAHLPIDPEKLKPESETQLLTSYQVRYSDLDMNSHVNNTRFAQWVLDSLPLSSHSKYEVKNYQINFLAEARPGDKVEIWGPSSFGSARLGFQGRRAENGELLFLTQIEAGSREN